MRTYRRIVLLVAAVFLVAPAALVLFGVRAKQIENRPLAPRPALAAHWAIFQQTASYLVDHIPLRSEAVSANSWILEHIFGTTPQYGGTSGAASAGTLGIAQSPVASGTSGTSGTSGLAGVSGTSVIRGRDGWLFFGYPLELDCAAPRLSIDALPRWEALLALLHHYGHRAVFVVAPEKSTVYPELVPSSAPGVGCGQRVSAALWRAIEAPSAARAGVIGLLKPLLAAKASSKVPLYIRTDTHWNCVGSLTLAAAVAPALDPRLRLTASDVVDLPSYRITTDLSRFEGTPERDVVLNRGVRRPPGAPKLPGPTLVVGDSFSNSALPQLSPFLAEPYQAVWDITPLRTILRSMAESRTVVLEVVERAVGSRAALFTPAVMAQLRTDLIAVAAARRRRPGG